MNPKLTVYELATEFELGPEKLRELESLAELEREPDFLARYLIKIVAVFGAALVGLGLIFWLAANWPDLTRMTKFLLLELLVAVTALGAMPNTSARTPLLLFALLAQGGLLAFFGQTYQTGADSWLLFGLWSALSFPLAMAARSDVLWVPFAIVTMGAIGLWEHAHAGWSWSARADCSLVYLLAWALALMLVFMLSALPFYRRYTGAGIWSFRTSLILALSLLIPNALFALFGSSSVQAIYFLGLLVLVAMVFVFTRPIFRDVLGVCALVLALDILLICGFARLMLEHIHGDSLGFLILGLVSAGIVASTAGWVRDMIKTWEKA